MSLHRIFYHRPRLASSMLLGFLLSFFLPATWLPVTRGLSAWNIAIWTYLILMVWLMSRANHAKVCKIAQQEDRSGIAVLIFMSVGASASLIAIIWELAALRELGASTRISHLLLTVATVVGTWVFVGILYTFHYARLYYTADCAHRPLRFPDEQLTPDYWDFLYFSFTIAVAAQTSDVVIASRSMRKTVLAQSVLSFFFNVAIVGFSINIAASLVA